MKKTARNSPQPSVVVVDAKSPPRIGPGSELTLLVKMAPATTLNNLTVSKGKKAVKSIDVQGGTNGALTVESSGALTNVQNSFEDIKVESATGEFQFVLYFSTSLEDLREIMHDGVELKLNDNTTISQPVIIDGLPPQQPLISRKDSVPTEYTRNVERFDVIQRTAEDLKFENYAKAIDDLLCKGEASEDYRTGTNRLLRGRSLPFTGDDAYRVLKAATEAYLLWKGAPSLAKTEYSPATAARIGAVGGVVGTEPGAGSEYTRYYQLVYARLPNEQLKKTVFPAYDSDWGQLDKYNQEQRDFVNGPCDTTPRLEADNPRYCIGLLQERMKRPLMIELIWSYWREQAMLAQTMYAIRNRVQNVSENAALDPLSNLEIGPLRPLNTLLWTWIQDEQHRLTVSRRNFEYEHQYGLSLRGKALRNLQPVDRRSRFLEAFHNLLYLATVYFKEDDDTNRKADAFPILHALKEVHFLLSEGAHNQFGELPVTARIEMMIEQWLLARPEFQRFLPTRESIAYPEAWMGSVDAMKTVQGWHSTSVIFFSDLARFGEMLLLSIRYEAWSEISDRMQAANWAKMFRNPIQGYIHAYRIVTGVDLQLEASGVSADARRRDPAVLIQQRWAEQRSEGTARRSQTRLPAAPTAGAQPIQRRGKV